MSGNNSRKRLRVALGFPILKIELGEKDAGGLPGEAKTDLKTKDK